MVLTLGTTMACIIFTAMGSALAQLRRGAVEVAVVRRFAPYVAPATAVGAVAATLLKVAFLKFGFAAFCIYSATRMLFFSKNIAKPGACMATTPASVHGSFFGVLCGMLGVGGANLFVPFMMKRNIDARRAMATASALQLPIAAAGTLAYIAAGLFFGTALPLGSLGYVYTPALAILVTSSMVLAPLGVKAAHALPVSTIKKVFAMFTALVGLKMAGLLPFLS